MRSALPERNYQNIRRGYLTFIYILGPKVGVWQQKRLTGNPLTHLEKVRHKMAFDRAPVLDTL